MWRLTEDQAKDFVLKPSGPAPKFRLRTFEAPESDVLRAVIQFLQYDPRVAFAHRMNTGAHVREYRRKDGSVGRSFIRYGFVGCPDVHGCLVGGRALYVETKALSGRKRKAQEEFMVQARAAGACCGFARSVDEARAILDGSVE